MMNNRAYSRFATPLMVTTPARESLDQQRSTPKRPKHISDKYEIVTYSHSIETIYIIHKSFVIKFYYTDK